MRSFEKLMAEACWAVLRSCWRPGWNGARLHMEPVEGLERCRHEELDSPRSWHVS